MFYRSKKEYVYYADRREVCSKACEVKSLPSEGHSICAKALKTNKLFNFGQFLQVSPRLRIFSPLLQSNDRSVSPVQICL